MAGSSIDVAYHEAGHAVIAVDEGIRLGAEIVLIGIDAGHCPFDTDSEELKEKPQLWGPKLIRALLGGQVAQQRYVESQGFPIQESDKDGWRVDNDKCWRIANQALHLGSELAKVEIERLRSEVAHRIAEPSVWQAIRALQKELFARKRLPGDDAEMIIRRWLPEASN